MLAGFAWDGRSSKLKDFATAREEVDRVVAKSEALGLRVLIAKARYLRATARDSPTILKRPATMRPRSGFSRKSRPTTAIKNVLKRVDLAAMYADCQRYSKG